MSNERRYQDHEIRQIIDLAIGPDDGLEQSLPAVDGLTLSELQEVGREVGLPAGRITQAVADFERREGSSPRGTTLGLPTSVGRVVPLPRSPSEREWELLVAELRTTFGGKGEMTSHGGLREWSHRNLHAFIEPTETGHRLRLADSNAGAVVGILLGITLLILIILLAVRDDPDFGLAVPAFLSLLGGSLVAGGAMALPKWARERESGMEHISRHAVSLLTLHGPTDD